MIQLSPPPFDTSDIPKFERMVAKATGTKYALATSSGTAAIHLALLVAGVKPGDKVLCPTFTFAATAFPILYCGAEPVFIDCHSSRLEMCPGAVRYAIGQYNPRAVMVASLYGDCPDYKEIRKACDLKGIPLIEDACEALGASNGGQMAGSFGDVAAISFNLNKIVTTGGGGALVGNNRAAIESARFYATQAKDAMPYYHHSVTGYNYRMPVAAATVGIQQLRKLKSLVAERRRINRWYREFMPPTFFFKPHGNSTFWLTVGYCRDPDSAIGELHLNGIEARRMWYPLHKQPAFSGCSRIVGNVAEDCFNHGICLPSKGITRKQVQIISDIVRKYL